MAHLPEDNPGPAERGLAHWVKRQRARRRGPLAGPLRPEQERLLEAVPGWAWGEPSAPAALLGDLVESRGRLHQSRLRSQLASGRVAQGGGDRASYPGVDARGTGSGASKMSGVRRGAAEAALPAAGDE